MSFVFLLRIIIAVIYYAFAMWQPFSFLSLYRNLPHLILQDQYLHSRYYKHPNFTDEESEDQRG